MTFPGSIYAPAWAFLPTTYQPSYVWAVRTAHNLFPREAKGPRMWEHVTDDVVLPWRLSTKEIPGNDRFTHDEETSREVCQMLDQAVGITGEPALMIASGSLFAYHWYLLARAELRWPEGVHVWWGTVEDAYAYMLGPVEPGVVITEKDLRHLNVVRIVAP